MSVPGVGAAGAWLGRSGEVVREHRLVVLFWGGTCPERDATRGMCRHDLQPEGQAAQPHRASAFLACEASAMWDPERCGVRGAVGSISLALPTLRMAPRKDRLRKAMRQDQNCFGAEPKCCDEAPTTTQRLLLEEAKVESERKQKPGQVTHFG